MEAGSICLALYQETQEARHEGMSFGEYLRESKDPTAKTVIFEDSAALIGIVIAFIGIYLTDHQVAPGQGAYLDGLASIMIGIVLGIVAFVLARASRGLLLGEAATPKSLWAIRDVIRGHPNVNQVIELLTMHLAPKQILVNAHVSFRDDLTNTQIIKTIAEIGEKIKKAEPKVDMIFLETAGLKERKKKD